MSDKKTMKPAEQRSVTFYGDEITAVRLEDGTIYVPIRPLCQRLGIDWAAQRQRIMRDAVLSGETMSVVIITTDIEPGSRRPRTSEMTCLPLDYLNGWLFGINANRVKVELRERVIQYQKECYRVLSEAFQEGRLSTEFSALLETADPEAVQAYQMALAVVKLARQQIMVQAEVADNKRRIEAIEAQLGDESRTITEAQATQLSQSVKAVAMALSKKSSRNEYGGVYGELYRKFDVTSYKLLPAARFKEAMSWLTEWHSQVSGGADMPF